MWKENVPGYGVVVVVCDSGDEYLGDATPCDACGPAVVLLVAGGAWGGPCG